MFAGRGIPLDPNNARMAVLVQVSNPGTCVYCVLVAVVDNRTGEKLDEFNAAITHQEVTRVQAGGRTIPDEELGGYVNVDSLQPIIERRLAGNKVGDLSVEGVANALYKIRLPF